MEIGAFMPDWLAWVAAAAAGLAAMATVVNIFEAISDLDPH